MSSDQFFSKALQSCTAAAQLPLNFCSTTDGFAMLACMLATINCSHLVTSRASLAFTRLSLPQMVSSTGYTPYQSPRMSESSQPQSAELHSIYQHCWALHVWQPRQTLLHTLRPILKALQGFCRQIPLQIATC